MMPRPSLRIVALLLCLGLSLSGCDLLKQIPNPFAPAEEPPKEGAEATEDHTEEAASDHGSEADETENTAQDPDMEEYPFEEVTVTGTDGTLLQGRLYDPYLASESEEEPTEKYPLVILLHGLNRNQSDWGRLPRTLVESGMAVLTLDLRGHGASTRNEAGQVLTWRLFEDKDWQRMPEDVGRVLRYFRQSEEDYPQLDTTKVGLIGATLGANVALLAADRYQDQIKAAVLLSPAVAYKGLNLTNAIIHYPNATFIAATQVDDMSFQDSEKLYRWALGPKAIRQYKKIGGGTDLLRQEPSLTPDIIAWLSRQLLGAAITPAPEAPASDAH